MKYLKTLALILSIFCVSAQAMPKNVIFFIGDGMGFVHVEATSSFTEQPLSFESFPYKAECTTGSLSGITDSAAAGTALATGIKVTNGVVSMDGDYEFETLLEYAQSLGKSVGLVTTTYLTHATPATFAAHEQSRDYLSAIASDYLYQTLPNVLFGGGGNGLNANKTKRAGYYVATDLRRFTSINTNLSYVSAQFGSSHMPYKYDYIGLEYPYPLLSEMVIKAIDILDNDLDGYFLMVEGGRIDHACHENNLNRCVWETIDFSVAVQEAVNITGSDTLIVVTADHETGGLTYDYNSDEYIFTTGNHTDATVPVYAIGPNAELISSPKFIDTDLDGLIEMDNTNFFEICTYGSVEPPEPGLYYSVVLDTLKADKGRVFGMATVTVVDEYSEPVEGAEVNGRFTIDFDEEVSGFTDNDGIVVFTTTEKTKKPSFDFIVDDVIE